MDLTLREAAALLGRPERTLRAWVSRGEIQGVKRDGRWLIPRANLPLTDEQRARLQARAQAVREAVEEALPSRTADSPSTRVRSIIDTESFRSGQALLQKIEGSHSPGAEDAARCMREALLELAESIHHWDLPVKLAALHRCRAHFARAAGHLMLAHGLPLKAPVSDWVGRIEGEMVPEVAALTRRAEHLQRGQRNPQGGDRLRTNENTTRGGIQGPILQDT